MRLLIAAAFALALAGPAMAQDYNATPNFGELHLSPGFTPDPGLIAMRAGGDLNAADKFKGCTGYITNAPDIRLYWDGTGSLSLKISAVSNADTTLVVNAPDGQFYCSDDEGDDSNPSLTLTPVAGRYEIWVGTFNSGDSKPAVVSVSELTSF